MNNKKYRKYRNKKQKIKEKIRNIINTYDEESQIEYMDNMPIEEIEIMAEVYCEMRIEHLLEQLKIPLEDYKKIQNKVINLNSKSKEIQLISYVFREYKGNYTLKQLLINYHDEVLKDGIEIGLKYGKKFIVEDIQQNRFTKETLKNISENEYYEYIYEELDEI